jgi:hypothetical protein
MGKGGQSDGEMLKGTLDMMILRTLITGDAHDGGAMGMREVLRRALWRPRLRA